MKKILLSTCVIVGILGLSFAVKADWDSIVIPEDTPYYLIADDGTTKELIMCPGDGEPCGYWEMEYEGVKYTTTKNARYNSTKYPLKYTLVAI